MTIKPEAMPSSEPLAKLYEKRRALSADVDATLSATVTTESEARCVAMLEEIDALDAKIRVTALRDHRDGGGIVLGTGKPVATQRDEFRTWATTGYRNGGFELRATNITAVGGTTDRASNEFISAMNRDSTIANIARLIMVDSLAPVVYYRTTTQMALTGVVAEAASGTAKDAAAEKVTLSPVKTSIYTDVSIETLATMPYDVAADLQTQHGELHAASWEAAFGGATGITGCQAIVDTAASVGNAVSVNIGTDGLITAAEAGNIVYANGLKSGYLTGASWLMHPGVWAATVGAATVYAFGGGGQQNISRDGPGATFFGYPVYLSTGLASVAAASKSGVFGNLTRGYRVHRYSGVQFQADPYTVAINGQVRYTSLAFHDAAIVDRNAMITLICS